ncbi:protein enabled-like isoform X4 [Schistocerca serialis cubense]|uniref:protein enabled-like isoform X4 n=1 Tax=Schistocerca serialis cubense TaxID=2023355 RepID=UPI00214E6AF9|nr:protein enabled-like isoform X4 [Schistocerca serialis cubense]
MGTHRRHTPLLLALLVAGATSAATLQPQPLVPGYGKEFRQFGNYNGIPIAPRPSPWIRAAEIQSADTAVYPGERQQPSFPEQQVPFGNAIILQRRGPQYPVLPAPPEQQAPPADGFIYQRMGPPPLGPGPYNGDQVPQKYEHSMLLIDHPPDQMMSQQQQPDQQAIVRMEDGAAGEPVQYEHSMLEVDHPVDGTSQQQDQQPDMSDDPMAAGSPAEETIQVQVPSADQQPSAQESSGVIAQVTQQDSSVPQGPMAPMLMPYQQGQRPLGVIFQSNEPYPGLSPPPAYQPEQVAWGVPPVQMPVYPAPFRQQPPQQEQQPRTPTVGEFPRPAGYPDDFQVKGGYQPFLSQRQAYNPPLVSFGMPPVAEDRVGAVPPPPGGVAQFPMPPSYVPETPLEETSQAEVVPDKNEQSESHETEKSKDGDAKDDDDDDDVSDEIENKVKALKDAVDVEEEVVPALVVFLRKKGHKAFHDKDSVGIPGKEDRFRRSPSGGSGSSSHSSSSSSSSSGPLYFGDGGGSYSSSSSQSSASSSSGGGAPPGLGAGAPGLGGGNAFYGGGHAPSSGYDVSGGGGGGSGGYGNTGYGNTGYGSSGYEGGGGGGYGGSGYGGGVGPSGGGGSYGGGCSTCGDDSNVLLNRFGEVEGGGPFTVGGSGTSKGQGVHSSASSSIDSTGKVTYTAFAGKH